MTTVTQCSIFIESKFYKQCFIPEIAEELGLVQSILIDKLDYWLKKSGKLIDNQLWIYNTFEDWNKQLKFFSISTIKRAFSSLEKQGYINSKKMNVKKSNHTKWYTINYTAYMNLLAQKKPKKFASVQNELSSCQIDTIINSKQRNNYSLKYMSNDINKYKQTNSSVIEKEVCTSMINTWNEIFVGKKSRIVLTNKRERKLIDLWESTFGQNLAKWRDYCISINSSKFLMGEKKETFKAQFDWLIQNETVNRVLSGNEFDIGDRVPDIYKKEQELKEEQLVKQHKIKSVAMKAKSEAKEQQKSIERLAEKLESEQLSKIEEEWDDQEKTKVKEAFEEYMLREEEDEFRKELKPLFENKWASFGASLAYDQYKIKFYLKKTFNDFLYEAKALMDCNGLNTLRIN